MRPRLREFAIEDLLLIGRQHAANLPKALPEKVMPLVIKIPARLRHLEPCIAQDVADSIALRRCKIEVAIHSIDYPAARHPQVTIPVRHRAQSKTNQEAGDSDQQAEPEIRPSWQDRSLSAASPAPMDRLSFRKSYSTRVPITPRRGTHPALAPTNTRRWSRIRKSPQPPPSGSTGWHAVPRAVPTRTAVACPPARIRDAPVLMLATPVVPSRRAAPAPSAQTRETHGRTSRIPSDAPAVRYAARMSSVLRHSAENSCRASKQFMTLTYCVRRRASAPPVCAAPVAPGTREFLPWPHSIQASRRFR